MTSDVKRPYRQVARAERAARTRAALRSAATELFVVKGYASTSMREVAEAAGVGERTLYDAFPTKEALFKHAIDVAIVGDEEPMAVDKRRGFLAITDGRDADAVLEELARFSTDLLERAGPLLMVAVESAGADPALQRFCEEGEAATRRNVATVVDHLARSGVIGGDRRTMREVTTTFAAIVSPHVHHLLRQRGRLSRERYRRWVVAALHASLAAARSI